MWKETCQNERGKERLSIGQVIRWKSSPVLRYTRMGVGKSNIGEWPQVIGDTETLCCLCGVEEETGTHLVFECKESYMLRSWD